MQQQNADAVLRQGRQSDEQMLRIGRQSDTAQQANAVNNAVLTRMLIQSGEDTNYADMNAAVRSPTTVEHPLYYPTGLQGSPIGQPATPPQTAK